MKKKLFTAALWCVILAFSLYLLNALFPAMGLMCVYVGMWADWICRSVMNILRYRSGKWLHKKLI